MAGGNLFPFAGLETNRVQRTPQAQSAIERSPSWRAEIATQGWEVGTSNQGGPFVFLRSRTATAYEFSNNPTDFNSSTYNVIAIDDRGNVKQSSVDTTSNGVGVSQTITTSTYDDTDERKQAWLLGLLKKRVVSKSTFAPDSSYEQTRTIAWDYDDLGLLKSVTREPDELNDPSLTQTTTLQRDGLFLNVRQITIAGNWLENTVTRTGSRTTTLQYDADGIFPRRAIRHVGADCPAFNGLVDDADTGLGTTCLIEDIAIDPRDGTLLGKVTPNGVAAQATYDAFGRTLRQVSPAETIETLYEDAEPFISVHGRGIAAKTQVVSFNRTTGASSRRVFDPLGRVVQFETSGLDASDVQQEVDYRWGNLVHAVSRPHADGSSTQGTIYNSYDARWRLYQRDFPDGTHVGFAAANAKNSTVDVEPGETFVSAVTDQNTHSTFQFTDFRGLVARTLDASGHSTTYSYGAFGELRTIDDFLGNETSIDTDLIGRVTAHADGDTGLQTYQYTAFDDLFIHTDGVGSGVQRVRRYEYDAVGRLQTIQTPEGPNLFAYDSAPNALGRLVEMTSATGEVEHYDYEQPPSDGDPRNNRAFLADTVRHIDGTSYQTSLHYDERNLVDRVAYPASFEGSPFEVHYAYDGAGNLQRAERSVGGTDREFLWERGNSYQGIALANENFGNNVSTNYSYNDDNGRLMSLTTTTGAAQILQKIEYLDYDDNGNLTRRRSSFRDPSSGSLDVADETFGYDELNRLTSYPLSGLTSAQVVYYDGLGNITSKEGVGTYNYTETGRPYRPHAVQNIKRGTTTVVELDYDDYGNLNYRSGEGVPGGAQTITYSSFNLPVSVTVGNNTPITYDYDASHERVLFTSGNCGPNADSTCTKRVYAGPEFEHETGADAGGRYSRDTFKVFIGGREIYELQNETRNGQSTATRRYLHADRLGSSQIVTDNNGDIASVRRFSPFGELVSTGPDLIGKVRSGFTGHETDVETGLVNMRGRIYDPRLGRFLQADIPFAESPFSSQGLNRYAYVFNNPLNGVDPSGFDVDDANSPSTLDGISDGVVIFGDDWLRVSPGLAEGPPTDVAPEPIDAAQPTGDDAVFDSLDGEASQSDTSPDRWGELDALGGYDKPSHGTADLGGVAASNGLPNGGGDKYNPYDTSHRPGTSVFGAQQRAHVDDGPLRDTLAKYLPQFAILLVPGAGEVEAEVLAEELAAEGAAPIIEATELTGVQANKVIGDAAADELAGSLRQAGLTVEREVPYRTPIGTRIADLRVSDPNGAVRGLVEVKVGNSPYTAGQQLKDFFIQSIYGHPTNVVRY